MKELPASSSPRALCPSTHQLLLFLWLRSHPHLPYHRLSLNVSSVITSYFPSSRLLVGLDGSQMKVFSYTEDSCMVFQRPQELQNDHVICMIDFTTALCLGGYPASRDAFYLHLLSLTVTDAPNMMAVREDPAVIKCGDTVYAFGGFSGTDFMSSCEAFSVSNERWVATPDLLKAGCFFPPALWGLDIYLPHYDFVQVYAVQRQVFRMITLRTSLLSRPLLFPLDGELFLLTQEKQLSRFRPTDSSEAEISQMSVKCEFPHFAIPIGVPVVVDRVVMWVTRNEMKLVTVSTDTWSISVS